MIFEARLKFSFATGGLSVMFVQLILGTNLFVQLIVGVDFKVLFNEGGGTTLQIWHIFLDRK
jgi:hypothetical protein